MYNRKNKDCPSCGKKILNSSSFCGKCSQLESKNHNYKTGNTCKSRVCSKCGNSISSGSLNGLCLNCYNSSMTGKDNPNYRNGSAIRDYYNTKEYSDWRLSVFTRDNFTCLECGSKASGTLNAHHILPKRDHPELIFDISNGITLCKTCHNKTYHDEYRYSQLYADLLQGLGVIKTANT